jgi:subtilisin family serine protease
MLANKVKDVPGMNASVYRISDDDSPREVADRVKALHKGDVLFAEPNALVAPGYTPNDALLGNSWHIPKIGAPAAWESAQGAGVTIAILDTGVDCAHADLSVSCLPGRNVVSGNADVTDTYGHGTKVAGTAAAIGDNTVGVAGVGFKARILPVKITNDPQGLATYADIASGIIYAADQGAKVANVSYAAYDSAAVTSAAAYLASKGGILTMSAGNAGTQSSTKNDANIIVVSATDMNDARTSWSSYGMPVDVSAPGLGIPTTLANGEYIAMSGTSFSAPIVAGAAAVLISLGTTTPSGDIVRLLLGAARDLGVGGYDQEYGFGRLDLGAAMVALKAGTIPTISYPGGVQNQSSLSLVSYAVVSKTKDSGVVEWSTNVPATGRVKYGLGSSALSSTVEVATSSALQRATITGLEPRKRYFYQVEAIDATGGVVKSPVTEFRTRR